MAAEAVSGGCAVVEVRRTGAALGERVVDGIVLAAET